MIKAILQTREHALSSVELVEGYIKGGWWPELRLDLSLQGIAADYYLFYAVKDASPYLEARFEEYAQVVSKQLAIYLDMACGGELQYKNVDTLLSTDSKPVTMTKWYARRRELGHELLLNGRQSFYHVHWSPSYGGPRWGAMIDLLIKHLQMELSAVLFVDLALALQHNTGCAFNKLSSFWDMDQLQQVLDANLHGDWETLVSYASPWSREIFLNWFVEEDEVEVEGLEFSRPRLVKSFVSGTLGVGSRVKVLSTSRSLSFRGKEGLVMDSRWDSMKDGTKTLAYQIRVGSEVRWLRPVNLLSLDVEQDSYEYIQEG